MKKILSQSDMLNEENETGKLDSKKRNSLGRMIRKNNRKCKDF